MTKGPMKKGSAEPSMLGRFVVEKGPEINPRMVILIWGPVNSGKTTLAATAPGEKLWLSFGDNEHVSVSHRDDVNVVQLHGLGYEELFRETAGDNPFGLDTYLANNTNIETVVCDPLTTIAYKGLQRSVAKGIGRSQSFTPTMEAPGQSAYGGRNANVIELMQGLLRVTAKHNVHMIFTAHEDDPVLIKGTENIDYIKIALGGKIVNETVYRISEVWHLRQLNNADRDREIYVRPYNQRRPMKTRMFDSKGPPLFKWHYDPDLPDDAKGQMTIAGFHEQWLAGGKHRIPVPGQQTAIKGKQK